MESNPLPHALSLQWQLLSHVAGPSSPLQALLSWCRVMVPFKFGLSAPLRDGRVTWPNLSGLRRHVPGHKTQCAELGPVLWEKSHCCRVISGWPCSPLSTLSYPCRVSPPHRAHVPSRTFLFTTTWGTLTYCTMMSNGNVLCNSTCLVCFLILDHARISSKCLRSFV